MGRDIVKAKLDIIFKKIFSDTENTDLLQALLSSLLDIPKDSIHNIVIENSEVLPLNINEKFVRIDLHIQVDDRLVDVEMQINNEPGYRERALYYWSRLYGSDLHESERYDKIRQCISISIMNFNLFKCPEYHSSFKLREDSRGELLTDKCVLHFFELKKINKKINKDNPMELWLQLINAETEEELDMLNNTQNREIQKAVMVIKKLSADEKLREEARLREKAMRDEANAILGSREEGLKEGIMKGMKEGRKEGRKEGIEEERSKTVEKLRRMGMTEEQIKEFYSQE